MTKTLSSSSSGYGRARNRIILKNGLILRQPGHSGIEQHEFTVFEDHLICEVNSGSVSESESDHIIDCSDCLIMPGLVNCHNHTPMSLLRGLSDDLPLDKWLSEYIFPTEAKFVSPDFVHTGALLSMAEMLLSGTTTVTDAYFFMEKSAEAAVETGIRAVVCQGVLDLPTPDCHNPNSNMDRLQSFLDGFPHSHLTRPAIFCHSPYLCGEETFLKSGNIAQKNNIRLFSHVSETHAEVIKSKQDTGFTPVELLCDWGVMDDNFVAVHAVHVDEREALLFRDHGTGVIHCPRSNMKLSSGLARVKNLLNNSVNVGLGTDGPASNNNLDMFEELRSAAFVSKVFGSGAESLGTDEALYMATQGGAKVLGMEKLVGSIEAGKYADIITLDLNSAHLQPNYNPKSQAVYSAKGSDVRDVFVHGKCVVRDKRIQTLDMERLLAKVNSIATKISKNSGIVFWGKY